MERSKALYSVKKAIDKLIDAATIQRYTSVSECVDYSNVVISRLPNGTYSVHDDDHGRALTGLDKKSAQKHATDLVAEYY